MQTTEHERRQSHRAALTVRVQYIYDDGLFADRLEDISEGGLRLGGATKIPLHEQVKLFVPVPTLAQHDRDALCLIWGEVIWRSSGYTGLRFVEPSPESLRQIREYVRRSSLSRKPCTWSGPLC